MPKVNFEYDAKDNASSTIDRITGKLQNLDRSLGRVKSSGREIRRSMGAARKILGASSALGFGMASTAMVELGFKKEDAAPSIKGVIEKYKDVVPKSTQLVNQFAKMALMSSSGVMMGGVFSGASKLMNVSSGSSGAGGMATSAITSGMFRGGSSRGRGLFARLGSFSRGLGAGVGYLAAAIAVQAAYEGIVEPAIEELTTSREYSPEYLAAMSSGYLNKSDREINRDIRNQSLEGQGYNWMTVARESLGYNQQTRENLGMQIAKERAKRFNEIHGALWLQNRE